MNSILNYFKRTPNDAPSGDNTNSDTVVPDYDGDGETSTTELADGNIDDFNSSSSDDDAPGSDDQAPSQCLKPCCKDDLTSPFQQVEANVLDKTRTVYGSGKKRKERSFQSSWFKHFNWLVFCSTQLKVFCFYCRFAVNNNLLTFTTKTENAFTTDGFSNWKKAKEKFSTHEKSQAHKEACLKYCSLKQTAVNIQLNLHVQSDQRLRRKAFLLQLSSLKFLLRQGLSIRGHVESEGNLQQLMKLREEDNADLRQWISNQDYKSPEVINEVISLMGQHILRQVLQNIRNAKWFAVIADEVRDISNAEQLSISIRWVDKDYSIHEDPIGLVQVPKTDAATLTSALKDALTRCMLPVDKCRGQAYDGASNMSGPKSGVAARILKEEPAALPVHCLAHCMNLCLQDVSRQIKSIRDALDLVFEIVGLIKFSPKREHLFSALQKENSPSSPKLKPLCPTRWTCRTSSINAVLTNYNTLLEALEEINETCKDDHGRKAGGLPSLMEKFSTFFGLKMAHLIFSASEQLSITLQAKNTTVQDAYTAVNLTKAFYERQRNPSAFEAFYQQVVKDTEGKTEHPTLPRYRKAPRHADDSSSGPTHRFNSPLDFFRQQYYEVMESLSGELTRRFEQKGFHLISLIESLVLDNSNGKAQQIPSEVLDMYSKDIDMDHLKVQLPMIPDLVRSIKPDGISIEKVTNIRMLCELFNSSPMAKIMFNEVHALLCLFFTIPATSATAERTVSVLKRMKTYLRSTMSQERLNNVMIPHIYKESTDHLNLEDIAETFAMANDRRWKYFGSFK